MRMNKVTIIQVIYNNKLFIEPVFKAIFNQTFKDFNVVAVISGNNDGSKEFLQEKFPQVEIIDPGFNIGFAKGHNIVFEKYDSEFFLLVNPDMVMEPNYLEEILKAFDDKKVGAATGKLYQVKREEIINFNKEIRSKILDTTGVLIYKSGKARDRGQHELDNGQFDNQTEVDGVSGAGCMYRRSALESVKYFSEYFDQDFHSYWEDVDLSWRLKNAGWKNIFVPSAVGLHGRGAASSSGGYIHVIDYIKHHSQLSPQIRQLNYRNHILMYLKNTNYFYPQFFIREFFMLCYIALFETSTLKIIPSLLKLYSKIMLKRKYIKSLKPQW